MNVTLDSEQSIITIIRFIIYIGDSTFQDSTSAESNIKFRLMNSLIATANIQRNVCGLEEAIRQATSSNMLKSMIMNVSI
jgi:hypothetical protein